jgi:type II secretory pathway pseudopilin PulG
MLTELGGTVTRARQLSRRAVGPMAGGEVRMRFYRSAVGRGVFSLMEITVVLVVLGVVGTIVGPRMSRGASPSPFVGERVLVGNLRMMREAVASYAAEHGGRPPSGSARQVVAQLTQYSDVLGRVSAIKRGAYALGPYLGQIPPLPVGSRKGTATLGLAGSPGEAGWVYDPSCGRIRVNASEEESDAMGKAYSAY